MTSTNTGIEALSKLRKEHKRKDRGGVEKRHKNTLVATPHTCRPHAGEKTFTLEGALGGTQVGKKNRKNAQG